MTIATVAENRAFDGMQGIYSHDSATTRCPMRFGVYMPPQSRDRPVPAVYWLSGLTCTEENFITKAGAQRVASLLGLALVVPDTGPRVDDPRRSGSLGLRRGCELLRRCHARALVAPLPDGLLRQRRASRSRRGPVQRRSTPHVHSRTLDGRPRGPGARAQESRSLSRRVRFRADRIADALPLGREGVERLPRRRSRGVARLRRDGADRGSRVDRTGAARRPGAERPVHRHAAEAGLARGSVRGMRAFR